MRNYFILAIAIILCLMTSSCASTKYVSNGIGVSSNEQVSRDISICNAAVDASRQNNIRASEDVEIVTNDTDGSTTTTYTSRKRLSTSTTFTNNEVKVSTKKTGDSYESRTNFSGHAKKYRD